MVCCSVKFAGESGSGKGWLSTPARSPARREVGGGRSGTAGTQTCPRRLERMPGGKEGGRGMKGGTGMEGCWAGGDRAQEDGAVMGVWAGTGGALAGASGW